MTGNIINNGTTAFNGIVDKLGNITTEFIPYILYIAIGIAGINLIFTAVKVLIQYLKVKNMSAFYTYDDIVEKNNDGTFSIVRKRKKRKKIKWKYLRRFR